MSRIWGDVWIAVVGEIWKHPLQENHEIEINF